MIEDEMASLLDGSRTLKTIRMDACQCKWPMVLKAYIMITIIFVYLVIYSFVFRNASHPLPEGGGHALPTQMLISNEGMMYVKEETTESRVKHLPTFVQPLKDLDCARLFRNDTAYISEKIKARPTLHDDLNNPPIMTCEGIRSRLLPARNARNGYPIAFARNVYESYAFLEEQLAISYAEENWYCFALDSKAPVWFRRRFVALATCLPNVLLADDERDIDSAGHQQNMAHLDCLKKLLYKNWNYVITMQNNDVIVKTNDEIATILQALNGTNDMEFKFCPARVCRPQLERNLGKLNLCPKSLNPAEAAYCRTQELVWSTGVLQISLTKETVRYMLEEIDLVPLITELNDNVIYGMDEVVYQSLALTRAVGLPGGTLPPSCINKTYTNYITRNSVWIFKKEDYCATKHIRHLICIRGMEDLAELATIPHIIMNKVMMDFDYGVVACLGELLFNRSHGITPSQLRMEDYYNLPLVRYNRERWSSDFREENFECYL